MNGRAGERGRPRRVRAVLWMLGASLAVLGVVLALVSQSWVPLVCVALGLGVPLLPLQPRRG